MWTARTATEKCRETLRSVLSQLESFVSDKRGNVALITAIVLPIATGVAGLGVDVSDWYLTQRDMQNAADAGVQVAATNGGSNYAIEAKAVTALYGFADGVNNVSVSVSNAATCPAGGTNCYSVRITGGAPNFLSSLVGYVGDLVATTTQKGVATTSHETAISAIAYASPGTQPRTYCVLALAGSGATTGFRTNGAPKSDLAGCNIMSNTGATCNGSNTNANYGDAHGTNSGCGVVQRSKVATLSDPYASLASNIPSNGCSSYAQIPSKKKDPALPAANQWAANASKSLSGNVTVCGDLQLTGNVTVNAPSNAVLVIQNGRLDTNGYTLKTSSGSGLTVVFSGSNTGGYTHTPIGGGILDIAAPTTGNWKGVALYQDPKLTSGVDISAAGNSPTWNITGLIYLPHSSVTFSGIINKATNGKSCFGMVVDNMLVNGTAQFLEYGQCGAAGLTLPTGTGPGGRGQLVG